jgi:hypothetical protein
MVSVLLAPYLRIGNTPMRIGPWSAIPAPQLRREDASSDLAFQQAQGLLELYQRSRRIPDGYGVFLRRGRRRVGEMFAAKDLTTLRRTLLVAMIESNPSDVRGDDTLNAGHGTWTSDNVDIIGHRIEPQGYVSTRYGAMTQTFVGGLRIGDAHSEIAPPAEVPFPMLGRGPDKLYCEALWDVLKRNTDEIRRLTAAIDWFDLAWRNTPSATHNMRVLMLKSAFEALLDAGDRIEDQRPALSALLDPPNARQRVRHFTNRRGNPVHETMTDSEWWYTRFTFLRNAIVHGETPAPRDLRHGRHWQLWIAEYRMRQAIKEVVARHGHPFARVSSFDRAVMQALARIQADAAV